MTFVDGDDYVSTDYIEKFYECAKKRKAELVICGVTYVEEDGRILKKIQPGEYRRFEKEEWAARISAVGSHFYKRSLWEKYRIRFQEGERGEDMPISLLLVPSVIKYVHCRSAATIMYSTAVQPCISSGD